MEPTLAKYIAQGHGGLIVTLIGLGVLASPIMVKGQSPNWDWAVAYGCPGGEYCYDLASDHAGNIFTTGYFHGSVDFDPGPGEDVQNSQGGLGIYLLKLDGQGQHVWARSIGGPGYKFGNDMALDFLGNIYLIGQFGGTIDFDPGPDTVELTSNGELDVFIAKFNGSGQLLWAKGFGGEMNDFARAIVLDEVHHALFLAGSMRGTVDFNLGTAVNELTSDSTTDVFMVKYDTSGTFNWARSISGTGDVICGGAALNPSGNGGLIVAGRFEGTIDLDPDTSAELHQPSNGATDIFISAVDMEGHLSWAWGIGGTQFEQVRDVASAHSDLIAITGSFQGTVDFDAGADSAMLTSAGANEMFVLTVNGSGAMQWARCTAGVSDATGMTVLTDAMASGNVCATGYFGNTVDLNPAPGSGLFKTSAGNDDALLVCWDSTGHFLGGDALGGFAPDYLLAATALPGGSLALGGSFFSPEMAVGQTLLVNSIDFAATGDAFIARATMPVTGISDYTTNDKIVLWPNPAHHALSIRSSTNMHGAMIIIYDLCGIEVLKSDFQPTMDISSLVPGAYVLKLIPNRGEQFRSSIIIVE